MPVSSRGSCSAPRTSSGPQSPLASAEHEFHAYSSGAGRQFVRERMLRRGYVWLGARTVRDPQHSTDRIRGSVVESFKREFGLPRTVEVTIEPDARSAAVTFHFWRREGHEREGTAGAVHCVHVRRVSGLMSAMSPAHAEREREHFRAQMRPNYPGLVGVEAVHRAETDETEYLAWVAGPYPVVPETSSDFRAPVEYAPDPASMYATGGVIPPGAIISRNGREAVVTPDMIRRRDERRAALGPNRLGESPRPFVSERVREARNPDGSGFLLGMRDGVLHYGGLPLSPGITGEIVHVSDNYASRDAFHEEARDLRRRYPGPEFVFTAQHDADNPQSQPGGTYRVIVALHRERIDESDRVSDPVLPPRPERRSTCRYHTRSARRGPRWTPSSRR